MQIFIMKIGITERGTALGELQKKMILSYAAHAPKVWMEEYKEMSCLLAKSAVLCANEDDVYAWQIFEYDLD